jgi:phage regulator Rha-like protein
MKQQTAVEYYSNNIGRLVSDLVSGKITGKQFVMLEIKLVDQAKEMEKEQIMNAFDECGNWQDNYTDSEHYYNETYGGNK